MAARKDRNSRNGRIFSEAEKHEIDEVISLKRVDGRTLVSFGDGEDCSGWTLPVVIREKHDSSLTREEFVRVLRDLANTIEAGFSNCYPEFGVYPPSYYTVPDEELQAILIGLHEADPDVHDHYVTGHGSLHDAIRNVGWIDPNVPLDSGIGKMLLRGWPNLYQSVVRGERSPFEALLEIKMVKAKAVFEACFDNGEMEAVLKSKWPAVYDSIFTGTWSPFQALQETGLVRSNAEYEDWENNGDIEEVLKNKWPELYDFVLVEIMSPFEALLEADLIDPIALYKTFHILENNSDDVKDDSLKDPSQGVPGKV